MKKATKLYTISVFIFLVLFFIVLHPIAISDTDDWSFLHHLRLPLPMPGAWNPIKVFPEIFMSMFSYAGAYILYPLTGRYCSSISLANGLFICLMMTLYFLEFFLLIFKKYKLSIGKNIAVSILFISLHFAMLVHSGGDNVFLLYAYDMTCIYHYILSTVVNASLVMHLIRCGGLSNWKVYSKVHKFLLIVWIYLAIFSSLYTNVVLAVYVGVELLFALEDAVVHKSFKVLGYIKDNKCHFRVLLLWLLSLAIEQTGGRAEGKEANFVASFFEGVEYYLEWITRFNILFTIFLIATILLWIFKVKGKNKTEKWKYFLAYIFVSLYIILLSAVVNSTYVERTDVMFAVGFWLLLILMLFVCESTMVLEQADRILYGLAVIALIGALYLNWNMKEINYENVPYEQCEAVVDDIIDQFKTADEAGVTEIDLAVPEFDGPSNWPYGTFAAEHFTKVMYRHGITNSKIVVREMVPSEEMTRKYFDVR